MEQEKKHKMYISQVVLKNSNHQTVSWLRLSYSNIPHGFFCNLTVSNFRYNFFFIY